MGEIPFRSRRIGEDDVARYLEEFRFSDDLSVTPSQMMGHDIHVVDELVSFVRERHRPQCYDSPRVLVGGLLHVEEGTLTAQSTFAGTSTRRALFMTLETCRAKDPGCEAAQEPNV